MKIRNLAVFVAILLMLSSCAGKKKAEEYKTAKITRGNIVANIPTSGIVMPRNRLEIKPPISGRVEEVLVSEGQNVKRSQVLLWLSSNDRATLLDAARSQGEEEYKKWQEVYKPAPIVAPINGFIIKRNIEPGQSVSLSDAVLVMADKLIVKAQVDETDIGRIRLGQPVNIILDAYPEKPIRGTVSHIAYEAKVISNVVMYEVDVAPQSVPLYFRSGMSATIEFKQDGRTNVLLVPINAVKKRGSSSFVFVKDKDRKPKAQMVELGLENTDHVELLSGLKEGDEILLLPNEAAQELLSRRNRGPQFNPFNSRTR
ncbi:MAG: macrolide-specific efflux protein MacA [Candidatus Saganbacteria bacterium]|uniref:Macrolide-specific efflux protein MacA n=1 Tax=Candidatus Saganbacteria bacterium TaxID=2575572 RepID=A0A833L193_UNCSA|nr:MAG: macrolide-specific efflux protein MacA [Candidatus Saganbacteria bacterium]